MQALSFMYLFNHFILFHVFYFIFLNFILEGCPSSVVISDPSRCVPSLSSTSDYLSPNAPDLQGMQRCKGWDDVHDYPNS